MNVILAAIGEALNESDSLLRQLRRHRSTQVQSEEERSNVRGMVFRWSTEIKSRLSGLGDRLDSINQIYAELLEFSERSITRIRYQACLNRLRAELITLRSKLVAGTEKIKEDGNVPKPLFSKLVASSEMQAILNRRWDETIACVSVHANLAATVMMGSLLEALLFTRANKFADQKRLFLASAAPKDDKGKPLPLSRWTLKNFIEVGYELKWIGEPAKKVSEFLGDYRNLIHPEKELRRGVLLRNADAKMFLAIFREVAEQVVEGVDS